MDERKRDFLSTSFILLRVILSCLWYPTPWVTCQPHPPASSHLHLRRLPSPCLDPPTASPPHSTIFELQLSALTHFPLDSFVNRFLTEFITPPHLMTTSHQHMSSVSFTEKIEGLGTIRRRIRTPHPKSEA